ncbi:HBL208Cp [Eremothecium sinecaudum]|uniref:HBL208Cp n=1 Tax=Eremothecium sinecaudum TaxID=45286 RepID=A0A120K0U2_9SACH|nr:HBL208Cp [Eremothecium sinecaudum]AMD18694.1 HBL208Cp [Eremothecium sinecaudum]
MNPVLHTYPNSNNMPVPVKEITEETSLLGQGKLSKEEHSRLHYTFLAIGVALLWPYNSFITIAAEMDRLFSSFASLKDAYLPSAMSLYFTASMSCMIYCQSKQRNYSQRISSGLLYQTGSVIISALLLFGSSLFSKPVLFGLLMACITVCSWGASLTQNGSLALSNASGSRYNQIMMVGQAIAGIIPGIYQLLLSFYFPENSEGIECYRFSRNSCNLTSAGANFTTSDQTSDKNQRLLLSLSSVMAAATSIVAFLMYKKAKVSLTEAKENSISVSEANHIPMKHLYLKLKHIMHTIFFVFLVTAPFVMFAANIKPTAIPISADKYTLVAINFWNTGDLVGRIIAGRFPFITIPTPRGLFAWSILRFLVLAVFFLFAAINSSTHSWIFDTLYLFWQFFFGVTNGAIATSAFMKIGSQLDDSQERKASSVVACFTLNAGLLAGSLLLPAWLKLVHLLQR